MSLWPFPVKYETLEGLHRNILNDLAKLLAQDDTWNMRGIQAPRQTSESEVRRLMHESS